MRLRRLPQGTSPHRQARAFWRRLLRRPQPVWAGLMQSRGTFTDHKDAIAFAGLLDDEVHIIRIWSAHGDRWDVMTPYREDIGIPIQDDADDEPYFAEWENKA